MTDAPGGEQTAPGGLSAKLPFGHCPRCRAKTLFAGVISFAPKCSGCGLDYSAFNVGDGAAAFLTLIVGGLISALAIWLQLSVEPPFWVHVVLWVPLSIFAVLAGLRYGKSRLLAAEYRRKAGEARRPAP
ncbi:DUF983 domain-containing protein [Novosphingobium sp. Gsoil 351]|uniref:DUF983 domain-containing protein n=1 Tax=Novosphingobium sp. Gsoil 351 TaxID=2675225 RepID=UPI0012B47D57|nr:DUF983 domain-containing protein [Novosphingobium sp. Gsoil 351]QGN54405.1 DUF983 domain-containing protein [Novosphingobium sp. Gsoil 351]